MELLEAERVRDPFPEVSQCCLVPSVVVGGCGWW